MAMMTVAYMVVRLLQSFDHIEAAAPPTCRRTREQWPSEETRYDMEDGDTTVGIGITMAARDGVWVKLHLTK